MQAIKMQLGGLSQSLYNLFCKSALPRRVCRTLESASRRQHVVRLLASQAAPNPLKKNYVTRKTSSWKYISCHTDKNRYYT